MAEISFGVLGILFGIIFMADYWVGREGKKSLKYIGLLNILIGVIPLIASKFEIGIPVSATYWFFLALGGTSLVTLAIILVVSRTLIRAGRSYGVMITGLDVLIRGYQATKADVDKGNQDHKKRQEELRAIQANNEYSRLPNFLSKFAKDIFIQIGDALDEVSVSQQSRTPLADKFLSIASYILLAVHTYIPRTFCRASIRVYDEAKDEMVCIHSIQSSDNPLPGPIPMKERNMIQRSMELRGTAIYSENSEYHYRTGADTICGADSSLNDYATQYVMWKNNDQTSGRAAFSVVLDVDENRIPDLKLLAKVGVFNLIGVAIAGIVRREFRGREKELTFQLLTKYNETVSGRKDGQ